MIEWRSVPGYEGVYEVSNDGQIRSLDRVVRLPMSPYERFYAGRLLTQKNGANGYPSYMLCHNGKCITVRAHRIVAKVFVDGYRDGLVVNHKDGTRTNNHFSNLEWVTLSENTIHASRVLGTLNNVGKFDECTILAALTCLNHPGMKLKYIGSSLGMNVGTILNGVAHRRIVKQVGFSYEKRGSKKGYILHQRAINEERSNENNERTQGE